MTYKYMLPVIIVLSSMMVPEQASCSQSLSILPSQKTASLLKQATCSGYATLLLGAALSKRAQALRVKKALYEELPSQKSCDILQNEQLHTSSCYLGEKGDTSTQSEYEGQMIYRSTPDVFIDNHYAFAKYAALFLGALTLACIQESKNCCCRTCRFANITAFGDSYTDIGNASANPEESCFSNSGRVAPDTNPGGKIWVQTLAQALCTTIRPSNYGGSDYALSGATSAQMLLQAQNFAQSHPRLCNNLITVRPVITDFINQFALGNPILTSQDIQQVVDTTISTVNVLHGAGACYILVPNMIDLGHLPIFPIENIPNTGTSVSVEFNQRLQQGLNNLCYDVLQVDAFGLEQEIFAKPCCYCFSDVTHPCCCVCPAFVTPDCSTAYFWDLIAPSARAHKAFADYVGSILDGPNCFAHVTEIPLELLYGHNRAIKQQLAPLREYEAGCPSFFLTVDYAPLLQQPLQKCCFGRQEQAKNCTLLAGGIYPLTQVAALGVSYGFSRSTEKNADCCSFDINTHTVSAYTSYDRSSYYCTLIGNGSVVQEHITRHFNILNRAIRAHGSTHGSQVGIAGELGYYFMQHNQLRSGLILDVDYNRIKMHGYTECGAGSANLSYDNRVRKSCITGLGAQITTEHEYRCGKRITNIFGMVQRDWMLKHHDVRFHVTSMSGSHARVPFCLPYKTVFACGFDTRFTTKQGIVATIGCHAKIGAKKYYNTDVVGALSWDF